MLTPAATADEIATTPDVGVVVLVAGPGLEPLDLLPLAHDGSHEVHARNSLGSCEGAGNSLGSCDAPAWVVLVEEGSRTTEVIAAGARGCLVVSSTPLQIGAAIRAAARGERADLDQPVTGPLVQRRPRAAPPLSEREVDVLRLAGAGLGNQHIAERLYLSLSTVKSHLSHTYGRLGVSGRAAAVAEARRQGLI